ncbi:unnamed protein product [Effrenium voratum]|nr:unnamed protein product [Effrenium voratum]
MSDSESDAEDREHPELLKRCFQRAKKRVEATGRGLDSAVLGNLDQVALSCSEALAREDTEALTWALERGRASIAAAANVSGEDGVSGSRRPAQRGPFGPEPPKRHWLNSWRPIPDAAADVIKPTQSEALAGHDPKLAHEGPKPKAAQEAVGKEPSLKERADAQARAGEYAAALRMYEELLEQGGADRLAVLCNAALMALKVAPEQCRWASVKQMLQLALKYSDEALRLNPNNVKAHFRRGCALEALERFRDAYFAYKDALALDPEDPKVRAAFDRIGRYGPSELGPDLKAQIEAERGPRQMRKGGKAVSAPKVERPPDGPWSECCLCKGAMAVGDEKFASPCGHGPFCGACRRRIEEDGRGLQLCAICQHEGASAERVLIEAWLGAETIQPERKGPPSRPFGPRLPPEMQPKAPPTFPPREEVAADATQGFLQLMD